MDVNQAFALDGKLFDGLCLRGWILARSGKYGQALDDFQRALELDEKNGYAHCAAACLLATCPDSSSQR